MDSYWLEGCDSLGRKVDSLPRGILNYVTLKEGEQLPRIGEKLEIMLNVEPEGSNDGHYRFDIVDVSHLVHQSTDNEPTASTQGIPTLFVRYLGEVSGK